jgi:glycosyltransferase involved in cell wall biosynthesis
MSDATRTKRPDGPIRVLVLATYLTRDQAGAAHSIITIVQALARAGWAEVTVAAHTWEPGLFPESVRLVRLRPENWPQPFWRFLPLTYYWHARRVIGENALGNFDFCYTQSIAYGLAYRKEFPAVPIVSHPGSVLWSREIMAESDAPMRWRWPQAKVAEWMERKTYKQPRWVHIASSKLVADARTDAFSLAPGTFRIAPLPIDPARFDPDRVGRDVRTEFGLSADRFVVIVVGRLVTLKRVDAVIRALSRIEAPIHLLIVGEGPERPRLEAIANELGLRDRVRFTGRQDPPPFLAAADLFVLPSVIESLGLVYLEAMMMGLPCIGLRYRPPEVLSAAGEVVLDGKVGFCVDGDDELRQRIEQLASDRQLSRELGVRARQIALERYTPDRYVALLRELAERV